MENAAPAVRASMDMARNPKSPLALIRETSAECSVKHAESHVPSDLLGVITHIESMLAVAIAKVRLSMPRTLSSVKFFSKLN